MREPLYKSRPTGFDIKPASQTKAVPVNDFIYLSEGLSNSYLITTDEGRIVVNTGCGFESPVHKAVYDAVDRSPTRYIILTQGHVDHVGGVDLFREEGTDVVAHRNNPAHQADDAMIQDFRARRSAFAFADAIAKIGEFFERNKLGPIPPQSVPTPTIVFDDTMSLELGGLRLELLWVPGGETLDSLAIWLPDHGICFTGNLFSALFGHFPNLVTIRGDRYREAPRFVESLERVLALDPELLLAGHHGPVEGRSVIREELERLRDAVEYVHEKTVTGMNRGDDVFSMMRDIRLPAELEVGEGYGKVSWSVRAIWETYAGWFHHRSTAELYGATEADIDGDILELAGADAVAERAAALAEAGKSVQAVQLAEIVLRKHPHHAVAVEASIAAHEKLRSQSKNFWESSWLDKQIGDLAKQRKPSV